MQANGNIDIIGAKVSAGEDLALQAKGKISVNSIETVTKNSAQYADGTRISYENTSHLASALSAGGSATIKATGDVTLTGADVKAGGDLAIKSSGGNVQIIAETDRATLDVRQTGRAITDVDLMLKGGNLPAMSLGSEQVANKHYQNQNSAISGGTLNSGGSMTIGAKQNVDLAGVHIDATKDLTVFSQDGNVTIGAVAAASGSIQENSSGDYRNNHYQTTQGGVGSSLQAGGDVTILAGLDDNGKIKKDMDPNTGNVNIAGSTIAGSQVAISAANDLTISVIAQNQETYQEKASKSEGFFSTTYNESRDTVQRQGVQGSTIIGDTVSLNAGKNLNLIGSEVFGVGDVTLVAQGDVNIKTAADVTREDHYQYEKTSGIFGNGGFGFTIGQKSTESDLKITQVNPQGSQITSLLGNLTIRADGKVDSTGASFSAGNDLTISGKSVSLQNSADTFESQYHYETRQSGFSVSLNSPVLNQAAGAYSDLQKATGAGIQDSRLKAAYALKGIQDSQAVRTAVQQYSQAKEALNTAIAGNDPAAVAKAEKEWNKVQDSLLGNLTVGFGSSRTTFDQQVASQNAKASTLSAGGNVAITATDGDLTLAGVNLTGKDVTLSASENINILAGKNSQNMSSQSSSSSSFFGVKVDPLNGNLLGATGSYSYGRGNENETGSSYLPSKVNATGDLVFHSGKDTNVIGSTLSGNTITGNVGGNLNIASLQDTNQYSAKNESGGFSFNTGTGGGFSGSYSQGNTNSNYASVTNQAGFYAGSGGFNVTVIGNTDLKGGVISSTATPDKNTLTTGSLTWSDIENKAEYSSSNIGFSVGLKDGKFTGSPDPGFPVSGDASSTTRAAISPGTITITGNPNQDLNGLNRDPVGALNKLDQIFDKKSVEEKQQLAMLFGKEAFWLVGEIAENQGWAEGSPQKNALHALVGGIISDLSSGNFASGAAGAGFNELLVNELSKINDPVIREWASLLIGSAAANLTGGNSQIGAITALYGTKYNSLPHLAKAAFRAMKLTPSGMRILERLGITSEEAALASEGTILRLVEEYNVLQARIVGFNHTLTEFAEQATLNPNSNTVVLGKYMKDGISYVKVAEERGATYFQVRNWGELSSEFGNANMWKINEKFLEQQINAGKNFILSHNPADAEGYFANEVNYLIGRGYTFLAGGFNLACSEVVLEAVFYERWGK